MCLLYRVYIVSNVLSSIKSLRFLSSISYLLFYRVSFLHKLSSILDPYRVSPKVLSYRVYHCPKLTDFLQEHSSYRVSILPYTYRVSIYPSIYRVSQDTSTYRVSPNPRTYRVCFSHKPAYRVSFWEPVYQVSIVSHSIEYPFQELLTEFHFCTKPSLVFVLVTEYWLLF